MVIMAIQNNTLSLNYLQGKVKKPKDVAKQNAIKDICLNCTETKCRSYNCKRFGAMRNAIRTSD